MDTTLLTDGDDLGMDLDGDGLNLDATINADGIEIGEDGEPLEPDADKDEMDGEADAADGDEGKEEEGADGEEEKEEVPEGEAGDEKADEGNPDGPAAPVKKKKVRTKSPKKAKNLVDENEVEMITWKASGLVKGRLVVGIPIKTPEYLKEYIAVDTERWPNGLDDMAEEDIVDMVAVKFRAV